MNRSNPHLSKTSERIKPSKRYQLHTYYNSLQKFQNIQQEKIKQHINQVFNNAIHSFEEVIKPTKLTQQQLERVNEIKQYVMIECINKFKRLTLQKSSNIKHLHEFIDNYKINFKRRILKFGLFNGLRMLEDLFNPIYIEWKENNGQEDFKYTSS